MKMTMIMIDDDYDGDDDDDDDDDGNDDYDSFYQAPGRKGGRRWKKGNRVGTSLHVINVLYITYIDI